MHPLYVMPSICDIICDIRYHIRYHMPNICSCCCVSEFLIPALFSTCSGTYHQKAESQWNHSHIEIYEFPSSKGTIVSTEACIFMRSHQVAPSNRDSGMSEISFKLAEHAGICMCMHVHEVTIRIVECI